MSLFRHWCASLIVFPLLPAAAMAGLKVTGLEGELEQNVLTFVGLASEPCDSDEWLVRRRFRSLVSETREALEPFGYYQPVIRTELQRDDRCWHATLHVEPGPVVTYRDVDIRLNGAATSDPAFIGLLRDSGLSPGAALRHADYDRLKKALQIRAADRGYIEARFVASQLDVWPEEGAADIALHFDSGPRYRLGEVHVDAPFLDPKIVHGYLDLEPGTPFDAEDLSRAHRDLADSAYFGDIDIVPDVHNASDGRIPIRIRLQPGTRIEYTIGVGASTDTGPRLRGGFRNNRVNEKGHRIIADMGISPVVQGLTAEYRIPLRDPRREWFSITGGATNEDTDTFNNDAQHLGARWTRAVSEFWLRTLSLEASNESFRVGDVVSTSRFVVPGIMFDRKRADRDVMPARGHRLGVELRGTGEMLGSTTSYTQATAWLRWVRSFGSANRLLGRINAGTTRSGDFTQLPPTVRFFAGGDESVRGFDYDSLGPQDADGNVIGGTNLLTASLEFERHLWGNYYGAVFVDAGNAFDGSDFEAEVGAGIGFKWRSPIGPVRLYLGYPLSVDDPSLRFHLRLGGDL